VAGLFLPWDLSVDGKTVLLTRKVWVVAPVMARCRADLYPLHPQHRWFRGGAAGGRNGRSAVAGPEVAIAQNPGTPAQFRLLPTKAGESRPLTNDNINHNAARWLPDGKQFVFSGNEPATECGCMCKMSRVARHWPSLLKG